MAILLPLMIVMMIMSEKLLEDYRPSLFEANLHPSVLCIKAQINFPDLSSSSKFYFKIAPHFLLFLGPLALSWLHFDTISKRKYLHFTSSFSL